MIDFTRDEHGRPLALPWEKLFKKGKWQSWFAFKKTLHEVKKEIHQVKPDPKHRLN